MECLEPITPGTPQDPAPNAVRANQESAGRGQMTKPAIEQERKNMSKKLQKSARKPLITDEVPKKFRPGIVAANELKKAGEVEGVAGSKVLFERIRFDGDHNSYGPVVPVEVRGNTVFLYVKTPSGASRCLIVCRDDSAAKTLFEGVHAKEVENIWPSEDLVSIICDPDLFMGNRGIELGGYTKLPPKVKALIKARGFSTPSPNTFDLLFGVRCPYLLQSMESSNISEQAWYLIHGQHVNYPKGIRSVLSSRSPEYALDELLSEDRTEDLDSVK